MSTYSASAASRPLTRRVPGDQRLAGLAGLAFLAMLILQNLVKAATSPSNSASAARILRFAHHDAWTVDLLVVTFVIGYPCLFLFAAGLSRRCSDANPASELWSRLGRSSVGVIAVLFGLVNVLQVVLVAARDRLAADPALVSTLWATHNAVFTLNLLAVGGALLGFGRAAALARLVPAWFGRLTIAGAGLLAIAAAPAVSEVHGSKVLAVGLAGFLCWLALLAVASAGLIRQQGAGEDASLR